MKLPSFIRLLALGCVASLAFFVTPSTFAADAKTLPLSHTIEKVEGHESTPFVLHVKNDSQETLHLSGKVLLAVVNHATDKAKMLKEHKLEAGKTWKIKDLTAGDKVVISAAGYSDLTIEVPMKP